MGLNTMRPIAVAAQGKGPLGVIKRARVIHQRYGLTSGKMDRILTHFAKILGQFNAGATFPITAAALARNRGTIEKYQAQNIEFAVHGYYHIDHSRLSLREQIAQFVRARQLFEQKGVICEGFRSPYLRWSDDTIAAVAQSGFLYDGSQGLAWDVIDKGETEQYRHVLGFYGAISAQRYPALPRWDRGVLRIPYCLPDDESLVDRLALHPDSAMASPWLTILAETHRLGELFTLGLHPERIHLCETALLETLQKAQAMSPKVWIARLDEVAQWWMARLDTVVTIAPVGDNRHRLHVDGPDGVVILARGMPLSTPTATWGDGYHIVRGATLTFDAGRRPFIGVSFASPPYLASFLRQQGYIVERTDKHDAHSLYLDFATFSYEDERGLLTRIEAGSFPLIRLGRWPGGARSALAVTGDIDALTIWDYGLRILGS